ncbi:hypothetical protein BH24ACT2_BH24ACT2_17480 [soil metagenome]
MRSFDDIDELHGGPGLRAFVDDVRAYASGPPPVVRGDLAAILTGGVGSAAGRDSAVPRPGLVGSPLRRLGNRLQGRRGRLALGASVLSLTVLGTGGAGALPGPAQAAFERTVEVVGIELPEEVRQADAPDPSEPAPVDDQDGSGDARETSPPLGEAEPDRRPEDDRGAPEPANPPPAGEGRPGAADGAEPTGEDLSREARERAPESVPAPVSPPRPGPPDTLPERPPAGGPSADRGQGDGNPVDEDDIDETRGNSGGGLGLGPAVPPGRPSEPGRQPS